MCKPDAVRNGGDDDGDHPDHKLLITTAWDLQHAL